MILSLVLGIAGFDGYWIGCRDAAASCTTPECAEVTAWASITNPQSTPITVGFSEFFTAGQAKVILSPSGLGGTVTNHATKTIGRQEHCSLWLMDCPAATANGSYSVTSGSRPDVPNNCGPKTFVAWAFCANNSGSGVTGSWNAGKTAAQE